MTTTLPLSSHETELLRVIGDALWELEHNDPIGALAILRAQIAKEQPPAIHVGAFHDNP